MALWFFSKRTPRKRNSVLCPPLEFSSPAAEPGCRSMLGIHSRPRAEPDRESSPPVWGGAQRTVGQTGGWGTLGTFRGRAERREPASRLQRRPGENSAAFHFLTPPSGPSSGSLTRAACRREAESLRRFAVHKQTPIYARTRTLHASAGGQVTHTQSSRTSH